MIYFCDTGILLRLVNPMADEHAKIKKTMALLYQAGHRPTTGLQNMIEFWGVCTRSATARGGFGMSLLQTRQRMTLIETSMPVLPESPDIYSHWRNLVIKHRVMGRNVHDARIAALMLVHNVQHILTLNAADFRRYPLIVLTPDDIPATPA